MPVIVKLTSGNWRAQVRRKGKYISNSLRRRSDADTWALEVERTIDKGFDPKAVNPRSVQIFGEIIDLHIQDMLEVGKTIRRSKNAVLESLKLTLGGYRLQEITRSALIEYGKKRAKQGAGPATLAVDLSFIGTLLTHAAAVHGIALFPEEVRLARVALTRLGLVGKATERDRRPTQKELDDVIRHFDEMPGQLINRNRDHVVQPDFEGECGIDGASRKRAVDLVEVGETRRQFAIRMQLAPALLNLGPAQGRKIPIASDAAGPTQLVRLTVCQVHQVIRLFESGSCPGKHFPSKIGNPDAARLSSIEDALSLSLFRVSQGR